MRLGQAPGELDLYYAALAASSPDSHPEIFPDDAARLAYWINAYNAAVLKLVLAHYPIESVEDVPNPKALFFVSRLGGFFFFQRVVLGGRKRNLYALEDSLIRKRFAERETRLFIAEPRNVAIDPESGRILLSSIFDWYEKDFLAAVRRAQPDAEDPTLIDYVEPYLTPEQREALLLCADCAVGFRRYDWRLNDVDLVR